MFLFFCIWIFFNIKNHIKHLFKFLSIFQNVIDMNETIFFFCNINKCRLNVMKYVFNLPAIYISCYLS